MTGLIVIIVFLLALWLCRPGATKPSRFHQAMYADNIRQRIASGQITKEEGIAEMEVIMRVHREG